MCTQSPRLDVYTKRFICLQLNLRGTVHQQLCGYSFNLEMYDKSTRIQIGVQRDFFPGLVLTDLFFFLYLMPYDATGQNGLEFIPRVHLSTSQLLLAPLDSGMEIIRQSRLTALA